MSRKEKNINKKKEHYMKITEKYNIIKIPK
jgi:hypothetical protein